jgi:medium-chain acyl-[acyl-carrier-protein] hydrolase
MPKSTAGDKWVLYHKPDSRAGLKLFCFPYAGGGIWIYKSWPRYFSDTAQVCTVQLPGRGMRWNEPSYKRLVPLAQAIGEAIVPHLDRPFAFFGHSMGATVSFELTRYLRRWHKIEPVHLFVSGRPGPRIPEPITYNLPDSEFIQELIRLNGTPKEVLGQPEVLKLTLPVVRADFEALQTYQYTEGPPLDCPITAFGGEEDREVGRGYLEAWRELTVKPAASRRSLERAVRRGFSTDFNPPERARYAQTERK